MTLGLQLPKVRGARQQGYHPFPEKVDDAAGNLFRAAFLQARRPRYPPGQGVFLRHATLAFTHGSTFGQVVRRAILIS